MIGIITQYVNKCINNNIRIIMNTIINQTQSLPEIINIIKILIIVIHIHNIGKFIL